MNALRTFLYGLCLAISFPAFGQSTFFVNLNVSGGSQDGSSWEHAFSDLKDALQEAGYGDEIWVAEGVYLPTNGFIRGVSFYLKNGVKLYGGFNGTETDLSERDWEMNETILSGDIGILGDSTDNSFTILLIEESDTTTQVDGFTFRDGIANGILGDEYSPAKSGGALFIDGGTTFAHPRIHNCRFENNFARFDGGAVYAGGWFSGSFAPQFFNCFFTENRCLEKGACVSRVGGSDLEIQNDFWNCTFQNNQAGADGGGIFIQEFDKNDTIEFIGCEFLGNSATNQGGGISIWGSSSEGSRIVVRNCAFENNLAIEGEGADFHFVSVNLLNVDFIEFDSSLFQNVHPDASECVYVDGPNFWNVPTRIKVRNCIFRNNQAKQLYLTGNDWDSLILENNFFENNIFDGTIVQMDGAENCRIVNNSFIKNRPPEPHVNGVRVFAFSLIENITFANNLFFDNYLRHDGLLRGTNIDTVTNCLIWNRLDTTTIDLPFAFTDTNNVQIRNSVVLVDELFGSFETLGATHVYLENTAITHPNCPVLPGPFSTFDPYPPFIFCGNNVLLNPSSLLADTAAGNYSLHPCSPARNAGNNAFLATPNLTSDLLGNARVEEGTVDIGPFEILSFDLAIDNLTDTSCEGGSNAGTLIIHVQSACAPFVLDFGDSTIITDDSPIVLENLAAGHYEITLTDAQGRTENLSADIVLTTPLTVEAFSTSEVDCETGEAVNATAIYMGGAGKVGYQWSTGSSSAWIIDQPIGAYSVTVTDAIGCTAVDTFEIVGNGTLEIFGEAENVSCPGGSDGIASAYVSGTPPFIWMWENMVADSALMNLSIGNYAVTITDAVGCTGETEVEISEPEMIESEVEIIQSTSTSSPNGAIHLNEITGGTSPYSTFWSTGETGPSIENLPPGEYTLTVTDSAGCEQIFEYTVELNVATSSLLGNTEVEIFPNPISARRQLFIRIKGSEIEPFEVSLFDLFGRQIFSKNIVSSIGLFSFEMPEIVGAYVCVLKNKNGARTAFRLVVD